MNNTYFESADNTTEPTNATEFGPQITELPPTLRTHVNFFLVFFLPVFGFFCLLALGGLVYCLRHRLIRKNRYAGRVRVAGVDFDIVENGSRLNPRQEMLEAREKVVGRSKGGMV